MATINASTLDAIAKGYQEVFAEALESTKPSPLFEMMVDSTFVPGSITAQYDWMISFDTFNQWIGDRKLSDVEVKNFEITSEPWESTFAVKRIQIETDTFGMHENKIRKMPRQFEKGKWNRFITLLEAGSSTVGYDGVNFFSASHPNADLAVQSNLNTSAALASGTFDAGVLKMETMKDHRGDPLALSPTHIIVPPALRATARSLFQTATLANGGDNPQYNAVQVIVEPRLTSTDTWYLFDANADLPVAIFQEQSRLEFDAFTKGSEHTFMRDEYLYGGRAYNGLGLAFWQAIQKNTA